MKNQKRKLLISATTAILLSSSTASADMLGAEVGAVAWSSGLSGSIEKGTGSLDFEKDLGFGSSKTNGFVWAYIDHPVPLVPNLKVQYTNFSDSAKGKIQANTLFNGTNFNASENVNSDITLNQFDIIPYYRILDNWINLDLGVNFKVVDGSVTVQNTTKSTSQSLDGVIPMLYGKARFDMPFSGLSAETDISYLGYSQNSIYDAKVGIVYETSFDLGVTAGYRKESINVNDLSNVNANIDIDGVYFGLFYHF